MESRLNLDVNEIYVLDLKDDFIMNKDLDLYQFLGKDPVKAYILGVYIKRWFEELDKEQQYLYSKQLRHIRDDIKDYVDQFQFWCNKAPENITAREMFEFVLNNMFWKEETEDLDKVRMALFLGQTETFSNEKVSSSD